jgi:hypothetical protein
MPSGDHCHHPTRTSKTLPLILYGIATVLQLGGAALIVMEIRDDRREALRIAESSLPVEWATADAIGEAFVAYLSGRRWRRGLGVLLLFLGALMGFAANLAALG